MSQSGVYGTSTSPEAGAVLGVVGNDSVVVPPNPITGDINIVGAAGITTSGNAGTYTLTIHSTAAGFLWNAISANQSLTAANGYICVGGGDLSLSLPATSSVGDQIAVLLDGSDSFTITQGAGQQIRMGILQTTLGSSGSINSLMQGDGILLVCKEDNDLWTCYSSMGNLTIN